MIIIRNNIIPFKGFAAINLFGVLFVRKNVKLSEKLIIHESIHTAQMRELFYIPFYIKYLYYYSLYGYRNNPFEKEAYLNQSDNTYLKTRPKFNWKQYI